MIRIQAPHTEVGRSAVIAAARMAVANLGGDGDGCGLVVRLLLDDVGRRSSPEIDDGEIELVITPDGTEVVLELRDRGEPISAEPQTLHPPVSLGVVTGSHAGTDGHGNVTAIRLALQSHHSVEDLTDEEILHAEVAVSTEEVTIRELIEADASSLTRLLYRCYGWSYPNTDLFFPERIVAALRAGTRIGMVAVTSAGEVVAHWGAVFFGPHVVESGSTVTDPRFRHRGIAKSLGEQLLDRLKERSVIGRFREPVLTHTATQEIALKEGAVMVGLRVNRNQALQQVGITNGLMHHRSSVTVAFGVLGDFPVATIFVPEDYAAILRVVLSHSAWPRHIAAPNDRVEAPTQTRAKSSYDAGNQSATIDVHVVGLDLVDEVDAAMDRARRGGAKSIEVHLPTAQPALAELGRGLIDLGLAYAAYLPMLHEDSDVLILQWLDETHVDTSEWHYASDHVEALALAIVSQIHQAQNRATSARRAAARRVSGTVDHRN